MKDSSFAKKNYNELPWWRTVRENVRYYRKIKGWTQADFAEKIGCGDGKIKGLEQGTINFTQVSIDEICVELKISIEQLFTSRMHYLAKVSNHERSSINKKNLQIYNILSSILDDFQNNYITGVVTTYNYNSQLHRIYYEDIKLLKMNVPRLITYKDVLLNTLKKQLEKEYLSKAAEELLKEKMGVHLIFSDLKTEIPSIYTLLIQVLNAHNDSNVENVLRIPIYVKNTKDVLGGIWVAFSGKSRIKKNIIIEIEEKINECF